MIYKDDDDNNVDAAAFACAVILRFLRYVYKKKQPWPKWLGQNRKL